MKMELDENSRIALVEYRIQRAHSTMQEAALLSENGYYNAAVNRLYYAQGLKCRRVSRGVEYWVSERKDWLVEPAF